MIHLSNPTEDPVANPTDLTRRVVSLPEAQALSLLLARLGESHRPGDLRDLATALRCLAGTLDRLAPPRTDMPAGAAAYSFGWAASPGS